MAGKSRRPGVLTVGPVKVRVIRGPHSAKAEQWYWRAEMYAAGSARTIWTGWASREGAVRHVASLVAADELKGTRGRRSNMRTVRDLMECWVGALEQRADLSPNTVQGYRYAARHIVTGIGDAQLRRVNRQVLDAYRDGRIRAGAATRTVFLDLQALGTAWRWARALGFGEDRDLPKVAVRVRPVRNRRTPTRDELLRTLEKLDGWAHTAALLLYATGGRLGEVAGLQWRDVDLRGGWIKLSGKTGPRDVPISPEVVAHLQAPQSGDPEGFVCGVRPGHVWNNLSRRLKVACDKSDVERFTPQGLRRFAVDEMARSGVDIGTACAVTGHSPRVMLAHYRRATTDDRRRAVRAARLGSLKSGAVLPFPGNAGGGEGS